MRSGTALAQCATVAACQFGFLAWLPLQGRPYLLLEGGELRAVVRADDAGVGRTALLGMPDQVGDTPVRAEAVAPGLLDLGVQVSQPRSPADREQHIGPGGEDTQRAHPAFANYAIVRGVRNDQGMLVMSDGARVLARRPSKPKMSASVANLQQGDVLIVERIEEEPGTWYVQVLMREDNTFQLEYREGVPAEHYQTRTVSREKVIAAVLGWAKRETGWKASFMWNNIGSCFEADQSSGPNT